MKKSIPIAVICLALMLILTVIFFIYNLIYKESDIENENSLTTNFISSESTKNEVIEIIKVPNKTSVLHGIKIHDKRNQQVVVDQTIKMPYSEQVLGLEKELIGNEITLFDGENYQVLKNYAFVMKLIINDEIIQVENAITDQKGKFSFNAKQAGAIIFVIITNEFAIFKQEVNLAYGKNYFKAILFKGGILEIRATNIDNEVIKGLKINCLVSFNSSPVYDEFLRFDTSRNLYIFSKIVGAFDISFNARGYQSTPEYSIVMNSWDKTLIEIQLLKPRKLFIDLDIENKPNEIMISIQKFKEQTEEDLEKSLEEFWIGNELIKVKKNKNNLYEYELFESDSSQLVVYVDTFLPQEVILLSDKDTYRLKLQKSYEGKIKVINNNNEPIVGAIVTYFEKPIQEETFIQSYNSKFLERLQAKTGRDGKAVIHSLEKNMHLNISVFHSDFISYRTDWIFNATEGNAKTIILEESLSISGRVKFEDKFVANATVTLYLSENGKERHIQKIETNAEGEYSFHHLVKEKWSQYTIRVHHHHFGVGAYFLMNYEEIKFLDLLIKKEKSILVKVIDQNKNRLPNYRLTIKNSEFDLLDGQNFITNDKGEFTFYNLNQGRYFIYSPKDSFWTIHSAASSFEVPKDNYELIIVKPKGLRKVNVTLPNGEIYKNNIKVYLCLDAHIPYQFDIDDEGDRYLDILLNGDVTHYLVNVPGFPLVTLGAYEKLTDLPSEININLPEGESLKVKVVDSNNDMPLAFATVNLWVYISGDSISNSMPTNKEGEIKFRHLSGDYDLIVNANNYVPFNSEIEITQSKELVIRLVKFGRLKCKLKNFKKDVDVNIFLNGQLYSLDADGVFELENLTPGPHEFFAYKVYSNSQAVNNKTTINIESGKTLEINLDDFLK